MKTKEEVGALLKELSADRAIVSAEIPPDVEAKDLPIYQIGKVRAQERIRDNENKYRYFVDSHIGLIILQGPVAKQREFAKQAEEVGATYTFNTLDLYRKLVQSAWAQMGGTGSFTVSCISDIYAGMRLLTRRELGIFRFRDPEISWIMSKYIDSMDTLASDVRASVNRSSGLMLTTKAINKYVCDEAIKNPIARMVIPVVALEVSAEEIPGYENVYPNRVVVVDLTDVDDVEEAVIETFTKLKNQLK